MKIVIRDDDACAFTLTDEIRSCYEAIWEDIPVSLSMTPFRIPGNDRHAPDKLKGSMEVLPLENNTSLVDLVREGIQHSHIDVSLHGYHHLRHMGLPEFIGGNDLHEKVKRGKSYLENLFNITIRTFVPPNNGIDSRGLDAVIAANMNLTGIPALWSSKYRNVTIKSLRMIPRYYWHKKIKRKTYPFVMDLGDHKEVAYHTVGPQTTYSNLLKELMYCSEKNGVFVIATHYHAFERITEDGYTVRKAVFDLIDKAMALNGAEFVGINKIW